MYLYAVTYYANWKRFGREGNGYTSGVLLLPYDDQRLVKIKALEVCVEKMPVEDGYCDHDVNCYKIPEVLAGLNSNGKVVRYKVTAKFQEL